MNKGDIELLYEYNRWANSKTLEVASQLSAEEFIKDLASSHASVRDTLTHILAAEWIWLCRWQGASPKAMLEPTDFPTFSLLKARWEELERDQAEFVSNLTDETLGRVVVYTNTKGEAFQCPLGLLMQHVVNHSSYHRGQAATLLRQLGHRPAPTDFIVFVRAKLERA